MEPSATSYVSQGSQGSIYPTLFSHSGGGICATYLCPQRREKRRWFNGDSLLRLSASPSFPAIVRTFSPRRYSREADGAKDRRQDLTNLLPSKSSCTVSSQHNAVQCFCGSLGPSPWNSHVQTRIWQTEISFLRKKNQVKGKWVSKLNCLKSIKSE